MKKKTILAFVLVAFLAAPAHASLLTFDYTTSNGVIDQAYGDRMVNTANVVVDYGGTGAPHQIWCWKTGYGNLEWVLENETDGNSNITITFTADSGFLVKLSSFDLANYWNLQPTSDQKVYEMTVNDGSNSNLYKATDVPAPYTGHHSVTLPSNIEANKLILTLDIRLGANSDGVGIDNIEFSQRAVPIPAAVWLLGSGLAGLVVVRRKFRKQTSR